MAAPIRLRSRLSITEIPLMPSSSLCSIVLSRFKHTVKEIQEAEEALASETNISRLRPHLFRRMKGSTPIPAGAGARGLGLESKHLLSYSKAAYDRKLYAKFGKSSGVDPGTLWPDERHIERELSKLELQKPLDQRIADYYERKRLEKEELDKHQKLVCERMAKMDTYLKQYDERKEKRAEKERERIAKRQALLEEAREFFGYEISHKDLKFQQMMEWKEEQEKRSRKLKKRQSKENLLAEKIARLTAEQNAQEY